MSVGKVRQTQNKILDEIDKKLEQISESSPTTGHELSVVVKNLAHAFYDLDAS